MKPGVKNLGLALMAMGALAFGLAISSYVMPAQPSPAPQGNTAQAAPKTAGETFKNIQVLKSIPANQLIPTMQFISTSLGVRCGFCHVEGAFWKDDKRPKLTARHMIQMELAINKENFGGRTEVTCYTCHRGLTHPVGVPVIAAVAPGSTPGGEASSEGMSRTAMPTADQILAKFIQASGGAEAIQKVSSRVANGVILGPGGHRLPVEVFSKASGGQRRVMHMPHGETVMVYNGHEGWMQNAGGQAREVTGGELEAMELGANLHLALNLKQRFSRLHAGRPEQVDGREADVLMGFNPGQAPVKLYFDSQSGLLVRTETFTATPLGYDPMQVDYADYRNTDGVEAPFRETVAQPGLSYTIQFEQVRQNIPVSDSEFAKPAPVSAAMPRPPSP